MELTETTLRFSAAPEDGWLYDCHAQKFAPVEHGASMATGFVPLFLSQLFGVPVPEWPRVMGEVQRQLRSLSPAEQDALLARHRPKRSPFAAAEIALLTYPGAERFVRRVTGEHAPFELRAEALMQPNVPLTAFEARTDQGWVRLPRSNGLDTEAGRRAIRDELLAASAGDTTEPALEPGCYVIGHSALLVRGRRAGVLFDPVPLTRVAAAPGAFRPSDLRRWSDAVAITHGHFDHYHLPSLLCFADRPIVVPEVPRASVVCEDIAGRLRSFGADSVQPTPWGSVTELDGIRLHTLPFVGEQFLTSECHPEARNWGNCYVVETEDMRVLVAADGGFEPDRSIFDVVEPWVRDNGPIDTVAAQAIGLHVAFGQGDPDLQITALACAHRAVEAFELLRPEKRVTLATSDVPRLVDACGARTVVLYGQFQFAPGELSVHPALATAIRDHLRTADHPARVPDLRIGEGVAPDGGVRRLPSGASLATGAAKP